MFCLRFSDLPYILGYVTHFVVTKQKRVRDIDDGGDDDDESAQKRQKMTSPSAERVMVEQKNRD